MNLTKLTDLKISELSAVDSPANMLDGFMVMKERGLVDANGELTRKGVDALIAEDGELTPVGALVVRKALAEGKVTPEDILSDDELAKARSMQPRRFIENFGAVRPPGMS